MSAEVIPEFRAFDKIARLNRDVVVTEKIDGTNAVVFIADDGETMRFGSRARWLSLDEGREKGAQPVDNFGFARWATEHRDELLKLGPGYHYGEWWGAGIQRRYGLSERRFSLFNVDRWADVAVRPACCHVVPTLATGKLADAVSTGLNTLRGRGSIAAPGFDRPEGIVVWHTAARQLFKVTLEGDEAPKSALTNAKIAGVV